MQDVPFLILYIIGQYNKANDMQWISIGTPAFIKVLD